MLIVGGLDIEAVGDRTPQGEIWFHQLVTVHDSFSVLAKDAKPLLDGVGALTSVLYFDDPMVVFGSSVIGEQISKREMNIGDPLGDTHPYT